MFLSLLQLWLVNSSGTGVEATEQTHLEAGESITVFVRSAETNSSWERANVISFGAGCRS